jgi:GNAT superfamily N-acetyltransferase
MHRLRPATPADYEAYVRLFPELGVDEPPASRERWISDLQPWTSVAERDGQVVGYCYCQMLGDSAYVRNVAVAASVRRAGIGRALMEGARVDARARGLARWQLNVKPDNVAAIALYRSLGLEARYDATVLRFPWSLLPRLPAAATAVLARQLDPDRDLLVERTLDLPAGLIGHARTGDRHVLLEVTDAAGQALGFARFSPQFPGAFPFRLQHPSLAGTLLGEMRRHALPSFGFTQVVVEDDRALTSVLVEAGAEARERIAHYEGPL